jgi:hypothetical protein
MPFAVLTAAVAVGTPLIPSPLAGQVFRSLLGELPVKRSGGLADFDHVAVGVSHVAADLSTAIDRSSCRDGLPQLTEREHVRLGAAFEEGDLKRLLVDRVMLAHELIQAAVPKHAVSALVDVDTC